MNKLNLGAGLKAEKGYINADINRFNGIDMVFDFNKYFPFDDDSFIEIKIKDCIHCSKDLKDFMEEIYRISIDKARIKILSVHFLSPICCQDPYFKTRIGFNTFDMFIQRQQDYYRTKSRFKMIKKRWIFSENRYLSWISFIPNLFPDFYNRFLYFYLPCNKVYFELEVKKEKQEQ